MAKSLGSRYVLQEALGRGAMGQDHQALYNWWKSNACAVTAAC
jgi:hypothetical protein